MNTHTPDLLQPFSVNKEPEAIVLITTSHGAERKLLEKLRKFEELAEAHTVHGYFDIVARFKTSNFDCLSELLNVRVKKTEGVKSSKNLLIA